jgi:hypothetical protein
MRIVEGREILRVWSPGCNRARTAGERRNRVRDLGDDLPRRATEDTLAARRTEVFPMNAQNGPIAGPDVGIVAEAL